jgi:hypothetical protein
MLVEFPYDTQTTGIDRKNNEKIKIKNTGSTFILFLSLHVAYLIPTSKESLSDLHAKSHDAKP